MAEEEVGGRLSVKARQLLAKGPAAVGELPPAEEVASLTDEERHRLLEGLRVELYAIASVLAEGAVERAYGGRDERPPYGLVRSGHTDWKMVLDEPHTVEEGQIDGFYTLGKAYVDTVVFHLDRQFAETRHSDRGWMLTRLEALLSLFRSGAGPMTRARMRDGLSFVYGGLHFGTGVSVQLADVMSRMLDSFGGMRAEEKAEVMARSTRPALRLAAFNFEHVLVAYGELLAPAKAFNAPRWFSPAWFAIQLTPDGRPHLVDFRPDRLVAGKPHVPRLDTVQPTYSTHGCPARISPQGGSPPIVRLWTWAVDLSLRTGLLDPPSPPSASPA
jgi:hypothetical protein